MASDTSLVFNLVAKDRASAQMGKFKEKMGTAAAGIGAAVGAGLSAALIKSMDTEAANDKLAAQLGLSPAEAAHMAQVSSKVYADGWGDSIATVNDGIRGVYQNIADTSSAQGGIQGVTEKVLALSETFDLDLNESTTAAGQLMKTGLASNADEALDIIASGLQNGVNRSDDFLDTLTEYGTQFRDLGLSGQEATGILRQGLQGGARDADVVADAMKELNIRVKDGTAAEGLKKLGLNADEMADAFAQGGPKARQALQDITDKLRAVKDPSDRARLAQQLLGTQSEDLSKALWSINPDGAVGALGKVKGAAKGVSDTISDNPAAKLETFKRGVETTLTAIGGQLAGWAMQNQGWLMPILVGFGTLIGIVLLAQGALALYNGIILIVQGATAVWTGIQWLLNTALLANPITWVVLAIIALIAIIVIAWQHSDTFRRIVTQAWQWIWDKVKAVGSWFKNTLWPWIKSVWNNIADGAGDMWNKVKGWWNKLVSFVTGIPGRISRAASGMWNGVKNAFRSAINWIISKWNNFGFTIGGGSFMGIDIPRVTLSTPDIPYLAKGGTITRSGSAVVGEAGPELISMPRGASVTPLSSGGGGGRPLVIHLSIGGRDFGQLWIDTGRREVRKLGGDVQAAIGQ